MFERYKPTLLAALISLLSPLSAYAEEPQSTKANKPNIVFILSDDQAWADYGFMGHEDIKTPNLDKLAEQSLLFKRGYAAAPICRPSLASLLTGVSPTVHGITGNDPDDNKKDRPKTDPIFRDAFHKLPSFVKHLTSNGYLAHQSGKYWEGAPAESGFTHSMTHGDPERRGRHGDLGLTIGREGFKPITDFLDHAQAEKKPFLLWYAPLMPHTPHNPPNRLLKKYSKPGRAMDVAKYYAMCEWFDETCGKLLNIIEQKKLTENTVVIYICDNGWAAASTRKNDPAQKTWKTYALRSKGSPFENGIRTPVMVKWPQKLTPLDSPDLAHAIDIFPTISAAAGLEAPDHLTGINLMDADARAKRKAVFGVMHSVQNMTLGKPDESLQYLWCIEGDWKLLVRL